MEKIDESLKTKDNVIAGCQSQVWLHAKKNEQLIEYVADSDAIMTKGIIALLIRVLSNQNAKNIIDAKSMQEAMKKLQILRGKKFSKSGFGRPRFVNIKEKRDTE